MRTRTVRSPLPSVGFALGVILCCGLVTFSAAAQTVTKSTTPGAMPGTGLRTTSPNQTKLGAQPPVPNCLKANPFEIANTDFIVDKITRAGYTNVRGLYKGCDALWRAHALQNGIDTAIMVTPTGQVIRNGYGALVAPAPMTAPTQ